MTKTNEPIAATKPWLCLGLALFAGIAGGCKKSAGPSAPAGPAADGGAAASPAVGLSLPSGFEGQIDLTATGDGGKPIELAVLVKGDKARLDIPEELAKSSANPFASNAYVILDGDARKLYAVLDARRQVILVDLNRGGGGYEILGSHYGPGSRGGAPGAAPTKVTKTGRFDTVAGYRCEDWEIASDHREATVCVADQGFPWFKLPADGLPAGQAWTAELLDGKHFPLRFVGYAKDGVKESGKLEVTKIEKKPLAGPEFEYPPGYVVMDVAAMFRGLGAMGGAPLPPRPPGAAAAAPPPPPKAR